MPTVTALMHGVGLRSPVGWTAFSSVLLVEGEKRVVFDSAHVGRRWLEADRKRILRNVERYGGAFTVED